MNISNNLINIKIKNQLKQLESIFFLATKYENYKIIFL